MRENICIYCEGSKVTMFGFKCKHCNSHGVNSVNKKTVVCPYCGHCHANKQSELEYGDAGTLNCDWCKNEFEVLVSYVALVSTYELKKKKKRC